MQNQIIHFLKNSQDYLSGEQISRQLNISRAAIWKNIEELRRDGYEISAVPHLGYKLNSIPDKLLEREVLDGLHTKTFGRKYLYFDSLTSTMDYSFQLGINGEPEGTLVCAEKQTRGRGRMERVWESPKNKGIYLSLILRPRLSPADVAKITLFAAVGVCEALRELTGLDVQIKWPNDLLIGGKKVAGILTELSAEMDCVRFVVVGIGVNVNNTARHLPESATSLRMESGHTHARVKIVQAMMLSLERWYESLAVNGFDPIIQRWRDLSLTLGKSVTVGEIQGTAVDLDEHGGLIIRDSAGQRIRCMSGDVMQE